MSALARVKFFTLVSQVLLGDAPVQLSDEKVNVAGLHFSAMQVVADVAQAHRQYWSVLS